MDGSAPEVMQCMEVWGGNEAVDSTVSLAGIEAWVYSRPFGESDTGGDVYYLSSCATGRITRLLIADVAGHGAAVGDIAVSLRGLMRRYINFIDQARFVRSMNEQFTALSRRGSFATAIVTTFFAPTNHLLLSNAGHPAPLIYRANTSQWSLLEDSLASRGLDATNIPLGIVQQSDYEQFETELAAGDRVICYTDSLVEARHGSGELLGTDGLLEVVRNIKESEPRRFIDVLLAEIGSLAEGNLEQDDVTVLLFRPREAGANPPLRQKLRAPRLVLGSILRRLRGSHEPIPWPELSVANIGGAMFNPLSRLWRGRR